MSSLEAVLEEARKLPPEERRELAERLLEESEQPAGGEEGPIWEKIIRLMRDVPPEDWEDVPSDGSINVDHYLYGAPKREP